MRSRRSVTLTLLGAFLPLLTAASQAQDGGYSNLTFQPKSEGAALRYSLFGAVIPVAAGIAMAHNDQLVKPGALLFTSGIMVGPSVGYFYGGRGDRGVTGIAIRLGLCALTAVAVRAAAGGSSGSSSDDLGESFGRFVAALAVGGVGSALIIIDAIYDIAKVESTVRKHNQKMQARSLGIVPTYSPDSDAAGLALQMTF